MLTWAWESLGAGVKLNLRVWGCLPHSPASPAAGLIKYPLSEHDQSNSLEVGPKLLKFSLEYKYHTGILLVLLPGLGYSVFSILLLIVFFLS